MRNNNYSRFPGIPLQDTEGSAPPCRTSRVAINYTCRLVGDQGNYQEKGTTGGPPLCNNNSRVCMYVPLLSY